MTSAESVRKRFAIDDVYASALHALAATEPTELVLPSRATARERLRALCVDDGAADDIVAVLPAFPADPDVWWLVTRCYAQLVRRIDARKFARPRWPSLARSDDAIARFLYVAVFLAAVSDIEWWYRERGIDTAIMWHTLADVGTRMRIRARVLGPCGRGLDTEQRWLTQHFTAQLFQLGRLQFNRDGWYYAPQLAPLVGASVNGASAVGVHIPEGGALDPAACDASFAMARRFFDRFFPGEDFRVAVCTSWLLDEQLTDYLPSDSNIVRFQRRFHMLPGRESGNEDVFRFVFDEHDPIADDVQPRTRLQHAVVDHLRRGGEWHIRTGWVPL